MRNRLNDSGFYSISQHLNLIATGLQDEVMKTRIQPIGNIWSKFPRTVRDLVVGCGKEVRIEMEGKETELDQTIIEAIVSSAESEGGSTIMPAIPAKN